MALQIFFLFHAVKCHIFIHMLHHVLAKQVSTEYLLWLRGAFDDHSINTLSCNLEVI